MKINRVQKAFALIFIGVLCSCVYNKMEEELEPNGNGNTCADENVTYTQVAQLLNNPCYSCHSTSAAQGGIVVDNHANLQVLANNGKLICTISHGSGCSPMPKNQPKLDACTISKIENWIANGAKND